jgi:hypothetical protein
MSMTITDRAVAVRWRVPAGWASMVSGVFGLVAFLFIIAALFVRENEGRRVGDLMFRCHDVAAVFQSLFMIKVIAALSVDPSRQITPTAFRVGVGTLWTMIGLLLLTVFHLVNDMLYMVPLGVFGVWLIVIVRKWWGSVPPHITRLGIVAGAGLCLVGAFPILFGIFVDPKSLLAPIPANYKDINSVANVVAHLVLLIGTLVGVTSYPIWSILLGRNLLKAENKPAPVETSS